MKRIMICTMLMISINGYAYETYFSNVLPKYVQQYSQMTQGKAILDVKPYQTRLSDSKVALSSALAYYKIPTAAIHELIGDQQVEQALARCAFTRAQAAPAIAHALRLQISNEFVLDPNYYVVIHNNQQCSVLMHSTLNQEFAWLINR